MEQRSRAPDRPMLPLIFASNGMDEQLMERAQGHIHFIEPLTGDLVGASGALPFLFRSQDDLLFKGSKQFFRTLPAP